MAAYMFDSRILYPDSLGYIDNWISRNCGYPLLIDLFEVA